MRPRAAGILAITRIGVSLAMTRRDLEKRLHEMSWRMIRHGARHDVSARGDNETVVPRHGEINEYTARAILREAGGKR